MKHKGRKRHVAITCLKDIWEAFNEERDEGRGLVRTNGGNNGRFVKGCITGLSKAKMCPTDAPKKLF